MEDPLGMIEGLCEWPIQAFILERDKHASTPLPTFFTCGDCVADGHFVRRTGFSRGNVQYTA